MALTSRPPRARARPLPRPLRPGRSRCLVISADASLCRRIRVATAARGWECVAPVDAAGLAAAGVEFGLVFIDLVQPPEGVGAAVAELIGAFAADHDTRVVVCGSADRPHEEIWARQEGVSVYLPGVSSGPGFMALVGSLCR